MDCRSISWALAALACVPACFDPGVSGTTDEASSSDTDGASTSNGDVDTNVGDVSTTANTADGETTASSDQADTADKDSSGAATDDEGSSGEDVLPECGDGIPVEGEVCFDDALAVSGGDVVYSPRLLDTNDDGNVDLVYLITDQIVVRLGTGEGDFGVELPDETVFSQQMEAADLDGDDIPDLVLLEPFTEQLDVALSNGSSSFALQNLPLFSGGDPRALAVADLDDNDVADVVSISGAGSDVRIFLANGAGSLTQEDSLSIGAFGREIAIGDFSGDDTPDVVYTVQSDSDQVRMRLGDGTGSLGSELDISVASTDALGLGVGDFNGDGDDDLAIANGIDVLAMLGTGAAGFEGAVMLATAGYANYVESADVTNDGLDDLIVSHSDVAVLSIFPSSGDGSFGDRVDITIGTTVDSLALGDANLDGIMDIVVGSQDDELVTVVLSTP